MPTVSSVRLKRKVNYPWNEWLKRRKTAIYLKYGKDYHCKQKAFVIYARVIAKSRGLRLHILRDGEKGLYLQVVKE